MVKNAGSGDMVAIEEATDDHFTKIVELNLTGLFRFCREAVQYFLPHIESHIINVTSANATLPICGLTYTSTNGAVKAMTNNIAIRLLGTKIRCNVIALGVTNTEVAVRLGLLANKKVVTSEPAIGIDTFIPSAITGSKPIGANSEVPMPIAPIPNANRGQLKLLGELTMPLLFNLFSSKNAIRILQGNTSGYTKIGSLALES